MQINDKEVHGYIQNGYIILHGSTWDHDDKDGHGVYVPRRVAINPSCILEIEDKSPNAKENSASTCIYYIKKQQQHVYESFDEIMNLINEFNEKYKNKKKYIPLYD